MLLKKRSILLLVILIIGALLASAWYFTSNSGTQEGLISSEKLLVSGIQNGVTYAANEEYYYALLPDKYYKLPKKSSCRAASPNDFTTWCNEWSNPNNY